MKLGGAPPLFFGGSLGSRAALKFVLMSVGIAMLDSMAQRQNCGRSCKKAGSQAKPTRVDANLGFNTHKVGAAQTHRGTHNVKENHE